MVIHEEIEPGCGLPDAVRDATASVVRVITVPMFKAQQPWALIGSTASVLQGIQDYVPPDIDITTTMEGAYIMSGAISTLGATVRPVRFSTAGPYTSYFGIFEVMGVKTEVMGDLVIHCADGTIALEEHWARWSEKVRILHFEGLHVPVVPLEWQLVANALLGRTERVNGIASYMRRHGWDRAYLDGIIADSQFSARTIAVVREALRLD